jgi:ABC-type antimicrobial peptide transport system permease subunit
MILKNLFRRKGRTLLTLAGIAIGVAAIVGLGALAKGMRAGYTAMAEGSKADLVLTQTGVMDITMGGVEASVADQLRVWPEVADVDGMLIGSVKAETSVYFFLFGYDPQGFAIDHFRVIEGQPLNQVRGVRGKPILLGRGAADSLNKGVGDAFHVTGGVFRIVGIYETGDAFEEEGALISLEDARTLLIQPRRYSMLYIRLDEPAGEVRLRERVERAFPDLTLSTTSEFADRQQLIDMLEGFAWGIAGLAVVIGGVGMTNTLFMSVFERTREIGLLRAVGWGRSQVMRLILGESLVLSLLGGAAGIGLGVATVGLLGNAFSYVGATGGRFTPDLFVQAIATVIILGLIGGAYPAWWASRLQPLEALRYEGGAGDRGEGRRFAWAGMAMRNIVRRRTRTALTLLGIGVGIAAVVALGGVSLGMMDVMNKMVMAGQVDLIAAEADVSDIGYSALGEREGARLAARPDVAAVSGAIVTFASTKEMPLLMLYGYHPREFAIGHYRIVEGAPLTVGHQAIVGRQAAETMNLEVGDTVRLLESNFRVAGIYETGVAIEDSGVVISLREAQTLAGKPHQVTWYAIKLRDPDQAEAMRDNLSAAFPDMTFSLTSEFAEDMPDMKRMQEFVGQISFLAVFIGAVGMLNTMLMSVLERTREIGVLRALGWQRRQVLSLILQEALALGLVGAAFGALLGVGLAALVAQVPQTAGMIDPRYTPELLVRVVAVALITGIAGGLYPAWRATRMRPVEALRYE